jgi:putative ATPase
MIYGGEDPRFIARRMVILASEDIGNADPMALLIAMAAFQAVERVGLPEARINLAQAAAYLAVAPKSNASYTAIDAALKDVEKGLDAKPPLSVRNAAHPAMKEHGYGQGYKYPHSYPGGRVRQEYLPPEVSGKVYYNPSYDKIKQSVEAIEEANDKEAKRE